MNNNSDNRYSNPSDNIPQGGVSKGELFVGVNILSKIGVLFIIVGIIAFSAASEGYIPTALRMAMVILVGVVMLVSGELFRRKSSAVFAAALSMGGIAELFVSVLIGRFAFGLWGGEAAQILGLAVAAAGFFLSMRYKNQVLLVVTQIAACLPVFAASKSVLAVCIGAACLVAIHAGSAIIARRSNYTVPYIFGACIAILQSLLVTAEFISSLNYEYGGIRNFSIFPYDYHYLFVLIFVLCSSACYISGLLLNAAQDGGRLKTSETTALCITLGYLVIISPIFLHSALYREVPAGIGCAVIAVILEIIAVGYELRFGGRCSVCKAVYNFVIASVILALCLCLSNIGDTAVYAALHIFCVILIGAGVIMERKLFSGWGFSLLGFSEILFISVLFGEDGGKRVFGCITNLVLWFALMAVYIIKKKHETKGFRLYACAAFANAGILLNVLISKDAYSAMRASMFTVAESKLLCVLLVACVWLVLGFAVGKPKFLKSFGLAFSIGFYAIGMGNLLYANLILIMANFREFEFGLLFVVVNIIVNIISVLTVLDLTLQITLRKEKLSKAVGLIVSGYALASLTTVLGMNNMVAFSSWIISVIYIVVAAVWIVLGFVKLNTLLRRFGLALVLLASAKLFLFDFTGLNPMAKTLMFIGFGITMLCISFGYGIAEKKLKSSHANQPPLQ